MASKKYSNKGPTDDFSPEPRNPKTATGSWLLLLVLEIQVVLLDRTIIREKWNKLRSVNNEKFLFTRDLQ